MLVVVEPFVVVYLTMNKEIKEVGKGGGDIEGRALGRVWFRKGRQCDMISNSTMDY